MEPHASELKEKKAVRGDGKMICEVGTSMGSAIPLIVGSP